MPRLYSEELTKIDQIYHCVTVLFFLLSSQTCHFLPVQGGHQHVSGAHLEWPRQL